jgi:hypothetical protein
MPFRFPHREPRDAKELYQWLRELLPELEIRVLENCEVGTTTTPIAHGLGMVPFFVRCSTPHCIALVRQVKKADNKNVYLRATNACVVDVFVAQVAQLAQLTTSIKNGGYQYPDWDPLGHDDHKVMVDGTDALPEYLKAKLVDGAHITFSVVVVDGVEKVQADVAWPEIPEDDHLVIVDGSDTVPEALKAKLVDGAHITFSVVVVDGVRKVKADVSWPTIPEDTYEVKATSTDTTHGALFDETVGNGATATSGGTIVDVVEIDGKPLVRHYSPLFYTGATRPPGSGSPGDADDTTIIKGTHDHPRGPAADPETVTRYLYPGEKPTQSVKSALCMLAPTDRWTDVDAALTGYMGCSVYYVFATCVEGPAGTWTRDTVGEMAASHIDDVTPVLNMRLFAGVYGSSTDELPNAGVYELIDLGSPSTPWVIRRAPDAGVSSDFTFGKPVHITGGTTWGGHTYRYNGSDNPTLGETPLTFYDAGTSSIYAAGFFGFGSQWEALDGAAGGLRMWRKLNETMGGGGAPGAPIYGIAAGGGSTFPIPEGGKFLVWLADALDAYDENAHFGLFELVSTFTNGTSPTIRRVDDVNDAAELTALIAQITGSGASGEGNVYEQTATISSIDNDPTAWTVSTELPPGSPELLTGPQIAAEGATGPFTISATGVAATNTVVALTTIFVTLPGTPGGVTFPAARTDFAFESLTIAGCTGEARLEAALYTDPGADEIVRGYSAPYGNGTFENVTFQALPAAPVVLSPSDRLSLVCFLRYTSTTQVTVTIKCGHPWVTKVGVPFDLSVSGAPTGRHQDLSGRELENQHPRFALTDAIGTATITGSGTATRLVLANPYRSGEISIADNVLLYGIDPTGWSDGQELELFVDGLHPGSPTYALTLVHLPSNADGSDIYVGVNLATGSGANTTFTRPVALVFKRRARLNRWQFMGSKM